MLLDYYNYIKEEFEYKKYLDIVKKGDKLICLKSSYGMYPHDTKRGNIYAVKKINTSHNGQKHIAFEEFPGGYGFYPNDFDLIDSISYKKRMKKREELNLKMKDIDPYGEENWDINENNKEYKTFDDLVFVEQKYLWDALIKAGRFKHPPMHARMTFDNDWSVSVLFGDMYYSNGINTYEIMAQNQKGNYIYDNDVKGYLTKDQITKEMIEIQKIKPAKRIYTPEDPYGEEDWEINESKRNKFHVGDTVYFLSRYTLFHDFQGENVISDILIDNHYDLWYEVKGRDKTIRWISADELYSNKEEYEKEKLKKEIEIKKEKEYIVKKDEEKRRKIEKKEEEKRRKIEIMKDVDPYGEEDWDDKVKNKCEWEWINANEKRISYQKELCPDIWEDKKMIEKIKTKLINIAKDFFEEIELETEIKDIHLTGSMASYNYNSESDIDVHISIDFSDVNEDTKLVKKLIDGQRFMWNLKHNITIKGHDVELYIIDINEEHISSGLYSLLFDEWIRRPKYNPPDVDTEDVDVKYNARLYDIEKFEKLSNSNLSPEESEEYHEKASELIKKILKSRKKGLSEEGEFSLENLVFKKLRKEGKIKKLIDAANNLYDKIYCQE